MKPVYIEATTLPDAWFKTLEAILTHGRKYTVQQGSYEGEYRLELDHLTMRIKYPYVPPLIPEIPPGLGFSPPTTMDYVNDYLSYLIEDSPLKERESYTYGTRIKFQMEEIIRRYKEGNFGSNQMTISISRPGDIYLSDPPCLRSIDCRVFPEEALHPLENRELHFYVNFRANDCFNGLPANLAALTLMNQYMASFLVRVEPGEIIYTSKGAHIYGPMVPFAKLRVGVK
jgi:thymidylate synthase